MAPTTAAVFPIRRALSRWHPPTPQTSSTSASTTPTQWPTPACCCRPRWPAARARAGRRCADDLGDRPGAAHPGRKLLTLVHSMLAGGDCIDDADLLRCGATSQVLGHRVMAPSTLGTFLRAFTFGHVRQLDRLAEQLLTRRGPLAQAPVMGR